MTQVATQPAGNDYLQRAPQPSGLADTLEVILDKGMVIDAYVRVSLIGIEILTVDARIVVASVDTYLRFAEAVNRLDLEQKEHSHTLPEMIQELQETGASGKTKGVLEGAKEKLFGDDDGKSNGKSKRSSSSSRSKSTSKSSGSSRTRTRSSNSRSKSNSRS
jgi:gas vesicle structural protein